MKRTIASVLVAAMAQTSVAAYPANLDVSNVKLGDFVASQNTGSLGALKTAYVGGTMIKALEEARMNSQIKDDPNAIRKYVEDAARIARKETEGVGFQTGFAEMAMKSIVNRVAPESNKDAPPPGEFKYSVKAVAENPILKAGLDYVSGKRVDPTMPAELSQEIRRYMISEVRNSKGMLSALIQKEFRQNEGIDLQKISANLTTNLQKDALLKIVSDDPALKSIISKAKSIEEITASVQNLAQGKLLGLQDLAKGATSAIAQLSSAKGAGISREEAQKTRDQLTGGFNRLAGVANLIGHPEIATKLEVAGQIAGTLQDLKGINLKNVFTNPANYLNWTGMALNLVTSLGGMGGGDGMGEVMAGIAMLAKQIADLKKTMLEEFSKLNVKIDGYFTDTFESLNRLEAGQQLDGQILRNIVRQMDALRSDVHDGFHQNVLMHLNKTLTRCIYVNPITGQTARLQDGEFKECSNILGTIAVGKIPVEPLKEAQAAAGDFHSQSGILKYLFNIAAKLYPNDFPYALSIHPQDWFWATENLLKIGNLHPEMVADTLTNSLTSSDNLAKVIEQGTNLYKFFYDVALKEPGRSHYLEGNKFRKELFVQVLQDYKNEIEQSLASTQLAMSSDYTRGLRSGLSCRGEKFEAEENDKFFETKLPLCNQKGDIGVKVDEPVRNVFRGPYFYDREHAKLSEFPKEGIPMTSAFQKYFPETVLFGAREHTRGDDSKKTTLYGCIDQWEIVSANHLPNQNTVTLRVHLKLGFKYYGYGSKEQTVILKELSGESTMGLAGRDGQFDFAETQLSFPIGMWTGGAIGMDGRSIPQQGGQALNTVPASWLKEKDVTDANEMRAYEDFYCKTVESRNRGTQEKINAVTKDMVQSSAKAKAALLFLVELFKANEAVTQFHDFLSDPSHFAPAAKWNDLYFRGKFSYDDLKKKLDRDHDAALWYLNEMEKSNLERVDAREIEPRLDQLKSLQARANEMIASGRATTKSSWWWSRFLN